MPTQLQIRPLVSSMKALVTGAAGFMGSHVAEHLLRKGIEVVALDDLSGGFRENVPPGALFVEGSVTDAALIKKVFSEHRLDYVFHLAAYAAEGLSHFIRRFNYTNNLIGSVNLINESVLQGVKCLVFTSSIAVYGAGQLPMTEDMEPRPEDPYGISKYAVELDLRAAHEMFGLPYIIFRPHNVYGEQQNIGDKYRNVIGIFMNQIMQGKPMTVFGDGEQQRAFSYIGDVAPDIVEAALNSACHNQIFNVGADQPYTVNYLARVVAQAFGVEPRIEHLPPRLEVKHAFSRHDKIRRFLGPRRETSLEEGIARMAEWAKQTGPRATKPFADIEVPIKLPPSWV